MKLVALEYLVLAADWQGASKPALFGQEFDTIETGNRYGLPLAYALHAWIWKSNPSGILKPYNPRSTAATGVARVEAEQHPTAGVVDPQRPALAAAVPGQSDPKPRDHREDVVPALAIRDLSRHAQVACPNEDDDEEDPARPRRARRARGSDFCLGDDRRHHAAPKQQLVIYLNATQPQVVAAGRASTQATSVLAAALRGQRSAT